MSDYLNLSIPSGNKRSNILKQTCNFKMQVFLSMYGPFVSPGRKGLRELTICETKYCEIKVCEMDSKK